LASDIESVFGAISSGFSQFAQNISKIPSSVTNFFSNLGNAIIGGLTAIGEFFYHAWEDFVSGITSVGGWLYSAFDKIAHFFEWLWDNIARLIAWLAQVIWNAFVTLFHWIVDAFSTIGNFIVQHINQVIHGIDPSFYGLWCNFRNKLQTIVTANVTEVMVYKSIESAAEGKISLRGLGDWIWFAARILGAPIAGQLAAAVLNMVLPPCGTPASSFVGQFTLPTVPTFTLPPAPSLVITPPSFITPAPSPTSLTYDIAYATTFSVGIPVLTTSLGVSFTYMIAVPLYPSTTVPLTVSFTYTVNPQPVFATDFPAAFSTCSFDPGSAARYLMLLVQEGSPSVAYSYIQQVLASCGPDKVQAILYAAADQYFFPEMIDLFTFNQPSVTTSTTVIPPAFFSSVNAPITLANCVRCTPVLVADYVGSTYITAGAFTMTPPGAAPGVNDGVPGTSGIVLIADSILGPLTLNANGQSSYGVSNTSVNGSQEASPSWIINSQPSVPFSVYSPYVGGYWWISPYTPPAAGQGACAYGGCGFIGAGGGGGASGQYNGYVGGWYFNTSTGKCYINPNNNTVVASPYLAFPDGQSMAVALMKAVSDLWLMYVLKVTPTTIAPMPVVGGGAGGGGGAPQLGTVDGPGGGSAGEVIVLAMSYSPLTVNAAGGAAGCTNVPSGGGSGAGGYVVVLVPKGKTVSLSANVAGGSPCTANSYGCSVSPSAGQSGVVLTPAIVIGTPSLTYSAFALSVSFSYSLISGLLPSWTNALGVSFTYEYISPLSISWTNALGVSFSHSP
jgi:Flp pilus assembly pilin Flp